MKRQSGKIKVLVVDDVILDGVSWWRNSEPFAALDKLYGQYLDIQQVTETVDIRLVKTADVIVRFRPVSEKSFDVLQVFKELGKKIIIDIDDDLWHVPEIHPLHDEWEASSGNMHRIYDIADKIWVSTDQLRFVVGDLGRCEVMQNAILPEQLPESPMEWSSVAAWRGNSSQVGDILSWEAHETYFAARDLYKKWIFAGFYPALRHGENAVKVRKKSPLAYFLSLKRGLANVLWKPLTPNRFNDAKSNIAWIEATMSGGVCVTNYADKAGWEFCFSDFPTDPMVIADRWAASADRIRENYNLLEVTQRRFESILNLV